MGTLRRPLAAVALIAFLNVAVPAAAQQAPDPGQSVAQAAPAAATTPPPAGRYLFPDLPETGVILDGRRFWWRPIFAVVADYTSLTQDEASVSQVGTQDSTRDLRAARLGFALRSKSRVPWEVYVTADYQERRTRENATFELYDLQLRIPIGPVKFTIGKMKEPFAYELTGMSVMLPQQERILNPFYASRNVGVTLSGRLADGRMTWAAGVFNDWLATGAKYTENARDVVGRVTALAWESPDKADYLHVGVGLKHRGADSGSMRFSGRPESNVTDKYVDTKDFPAGGANQVSVEGLWARGPFSVLGEHIGAWVDAPERKDPHFSGSYLLGSWMLTGEARPYVRMLGYAGGVKPTRRYGAVELVAKYSRVDLRDGGIDGGVLGKWHYGVNWWASAQWKLGLSYGDADLDRSGLRGKTKMWLSRLQWLF